MPKFDWQARNKAGSVQKGTMEAANIALVEAQLKRYGFTGITVKEAGKALELKIPVFGAKKSRPRTW